MNFTRRGTTVNRLEMGGYRDGHEFRVEASITTFVGPCPVPSCVPAQLSLLSPFLLPHPSPSSAPPVPSVSLLQPPPPPEQGQRRHTRPQVGLNSTPPSQPTISERF
ncbi:hypothetical protein PHLCEN_2v7584 [Hermanssonia centrifuga]|uniref:Uncharacterized protein n=1 Tax=Hermanssonia centrifuga TaxID=98765 RepID=A0A2R6NW35_9APHY|nr:hypothetical protein PHLCEN_2v7584 [Hermanssonia centrifuga]